MKANYGRTHCAHVDYAEVKIVDKGLYRTACGAGLVLYGRQVSHDPDDIDCKRCKAWLFENVQFFNWLKAQKAARVATMRALEKLT